MASPVSERLPGSIRVRFDRGSRATPDCLVQSRERGAPPPRLTRCRPAEPPLGPGLPTHRRCWDSAPAPFEIASQPEMNGPVEDLRSQDLWLRRNSRDTGDVPARSLQVPFRWRCHGTLSTQSGERYRPLGGTWFEPLSRSGGQTSSAREANRKWLLGRVCSNSWRSRNLLEPPGP